MRTETICVDILTLDKELPSGRIFSAQLVKQAIDQQEELIRGGKFLGCFQKDFEQNGMLSVDDISHVIHSLTIQGDKLRGVIEILDTPKGRLLKALHPHLIFNIMAEMTTENSDLTGNVLSMRLVSVVAAIEKPLGEPL